LLLKTVKATHEATGIIRSFFIKFKKREEKGGKKSTRQTQNVFPTEKFSYHPKSKQNKPGNKLPGNTLMATRSWRNAHA
jgi:hypothetical protein